MSHHGIRSSPESDINHNVSSYSTVNSIFNFCPPHNPSAQSWSLIYLFSRSLPFIRWLLFGNGPLILLLWMSSSHPEQRVAKSVSQRCLLIVADRLINLRNNTAAAAAAAATWGGVGTRTNINRHQWECMPADTHCVPNLSSVARWTCSFYLSQREQVCEHVQSDVRVC